jgi:hypothetical protein
LCGRFTGNVGDCYRAAPRIERHLAVACLAAACADLLERGFDLGRDPMLDIELEAEESGRRDHDDGDQPDQDFSHRVSSGAGDAGGELPYCSETNVIAGDCDSSCDGFCRLAALSFVGGRGVGGCIRTAGRASHPAQFAGKLILGRVNETKIRGRKRGSTYVVLF